MYTKTVNGTQLYLYASTINDNGVDKAAWQISTSSNKTSWSIGEEGFPDGIVLYKFGSLGSGTWNSGIYGQQAFNLNGTENVTITNYQSQPSSSSSSSSSITSQSSVSGSSSESGSGVVVGYRVSGAGYDDYNGDYYPNSAMYGGEPEYQLQGGSKILAYNSSQNRWEIADNEEMIAMVGGYYYSSAITGQYSSGYGSSTPPTVSAIYESGSGSSSEASSLSSSSTPQSSPCVRLSGGTGSYASLNGDYTRTAQTTTVEGMTLPVYRLGVTDNYLFRTYSDFEGKGIWLIAGSSEVSDSFGANVSEVSGIYSPTFSADPTDCTYYEGSGSGTIPTFTDVDNYVTYGTLTVNITNDGNGGTWSFDGGSTKRNSGTFRVIPGSYTVSFHSSNGYTPPSSQSVTVISGGSQTINASYSFAGCLLKGTKITLADGTQKNVEDITYEDNLKVWDFDNGVITSAKPLWIMAEQYSDHYWHNTYSDGRILDVFGPDNTGHRAFSREKNQFAYTTQTSGDTIVTDGEDITQLSSQYVHGTCKYYNIITDYHYNLYANGILTSCSLNNLYGFDQTSMTFVKEERAMPDMTVYDGVPQKYIDGLRLAEQPANKRPYVNNLIAWAVENN